jgi:hypothetical protein
MEIAKTRTTLCLRRHHRPLLELQNLVDPVLEGRYSGVDARLVGFRAPDAPRDDAGQCPAFVIALDYHGTAGIALKLPCILA